MSEDIRNNKGKNKETETKNMKECIPLPIKSEEYVSMVDKWLKKEKLYQVEATQASFVLLMSDFLFSQIRLPPMWLDWAYTLKMIGLKADPETAESKHLQNETLTEAQIVVVKMLFKGHAKMKDIAMSSRARYHLIGLLEFISQINMYKVNNLEKAIIVSRGQEQIKALSNAMVDISNSYNSSDKIDRELEMNIYDFASSNRRMVFAALLIGRAIADTILRHGRDDHDVVAEVNFLYRESEEVLKYKEKGNFHFKAGNYKEALSVYTKAIGMSKYSAVLYGNRCQTALKLKIYKLAICDGYRATALRPDWGKAYYRQAEAFKGDKQLQAAIECNELGQKICDDLSPEMADLQKQEQKLRETSLNEDVDCPKLDNIAYVEEIIPEEETTVRTKKSKKSKKGKKKLLKSNGLEEQVPPLISDDDSLKGLSDREQSVAKYFKKPASKNEKSSKKHKQEAKSENDKTRLKFEKPDKTKENKTPNDLDDDLENEYSPQKDYVKHKITGSEAILRKDFALALKEYDSAICMIEKSNRNKEWKVSNLERFALIYARGYASLEMKTPLEVARSFDFFSLIITSNNADMDVLHPLPFYAIAKAQLLLNNFSMVSKPVQSGMKLLKTKRTKSLTWPGMETEIRESRVDVLRKLMRDLLESAQHPPAPDAICLYDRCEKDDKNESRIYSMCDKDIFRKEIYTTDLNFEGFMKIYCTWNCMLTFHYKCWAKFKHIFFQKSGDKEILDLPCITDGCRGTISRIVMIDENQAKKKDIGSSEKRVVKEQPPKSSSQMSKNEQNLARRRKQIEEAKHKKRLRRKENEESDALIDTASGKSKEDGPKVVKVITEADIAGATIVRRDDSNFTQVTKSKNKKSKKKISGNAPISLQDFLHVNKNGLTMAEIERALSSRSSDNPFETPESLRDDLDQFEEEYDQGLYPISILYDYFENYFEDQGPVNINDDLLQQQYLLLPDAVKKIIDRHKGIIQFLCQRSDKFLVMHPYIGLPVHHPEMLQLVQLHKVSHLNENSRVSYEESRVSAMDTLDCDFDTAASLSDFAKDLYDVGEVPLSEIQNLTGSTSTGNLTSNHKFENIDRRSQEITLSSKMADSLDDLSVGWRVVSDKSQDNPSNKSTHHGDGDNLNSLDLCDRMDCYLKRNDSLDSFDEIISTSDVSSGKSNKSDENDNVDADELTKTREVQTELIPSYEEEMYKLQCEKQLLEKRLEELNDRFTRLNISTRTELATKTKELEEVKERLQITKMKALEATQHAEAELKKISNDRSTWYDKVKVLKAQLKESTDKYNEIEQKLNDKESDLDRLSRVLQEQRSNWLSEKLVGDREKEALKESLKLAANRAMEAELKALEVEESYGLKVLLKARSECERITAEFEKLGRHHIANPAAHREVLAGLLQWRSNIEACNQYIDQTKRQYALHADMIRGGKKLSELSPISMPSPPSPGPNIQQVAMAALQAPGVGTSTMPINSFPVNRPTSPAILNSETLTPSATPRVPQPPIGTGKGASAGTQNKKNGITQQAESTASSSAQSLGSFEKIMMQLQTLYPTVSRTDLALCIKEVRRHNNNSLTGLSLEDIVHKSSTVVDKKGLVGNVAGVPGPSSSMTSVGVRASSASPWFNRPGQARLSTSSSAGEEESCVICHEPLNSSKVHKLQCGHAFHNNCLAKWLERNRTCPTCRDYAIDTSEYPALSNVMRR